MNKSERRSIGGLAAIYAMRMLGLFLILPVFALYAGTLRGHTLFLTGMALGVYGLTQAVLQIPFGMLSDRFGRKPVIAAGLGIFAVGSVIAAVSDTIHGVILGRALQGSGAISAAVIAMAADLTREEVRTKAMAILGVTIGASFVTALLLGPLLYKVIGVPGIFWLTAGLALSAVIVLQSWVPTPVRSSIHRDAQAVPGQFLCLLRDSRLLRLDVGILILHCALMAMFVVVPLALAEYAGMSAGDLWKVYLPVVLSSAIFLFPLSYLADKKNMTRPVFTAAVFVLILSQALLFYEYRSLSGIVMGLFLFFLAFNILEAMLPALISKTAPADKKGTAVGIYSTFQFLGVFIGGSVGGWLYGEYGMTVVFEFVGVLLFIWFLLALTMPPPEDLSTRLLRVGPQSPDRAKRLAQKLGAIQGVREATVIAEEGVAYLKVNDQALDRSALGKYQH